jgi:cell division protein ZapA
LVDIYLSGRKYSVSCEGGQEARLRQLGEHVGARLRELAETGVTGSDAHMLALAALLVADEVFDLKEESEKTRTRGSKEPQRDHAAAAIDAVTRRIEDLATRLERP